MNGSPLVSLNVKGFRSLRELQLDLTPATILLGPNGAGKSNLLSVLRLVPLLRTQSLRRFIGEQGGASSLLHYGPSVTRELSVELVFQDGDRRDRYSARLGYAAGDSLIFLDEIAASQENSGARWVEESLGAGHNESRLAQIATGRESTPTTGVVNQLLSKLTFYHFHDSSPTSPLRQNATQSDGRLLRSDGSNLAAFLFRLRSSREDEAIRSWTMIRTLTRRIAPFIKELEPDRVVPENPNGSPVHLYWTDERDRRFSAADFSDGTLRAIALITALAQPESTLPSLMSIDEPELGLHPAALALIAALVRSIEDKCRVVLSTQSAALLNHFNPHEVVVVERNRGESSFRRLPLDELDVWLKDYTLAELYDKNLLGGRP